MQDSASANLPGHFTPPETGWRKVKGILKDLPIGLLDLIIHYALRPFPIDWVSHVGIYLGLFARMRYPESDARAKIAWQTLRPEHADTEATEAALVRLWRCVGRTMAEYSVLWRLLPSGRVKIEGAEELKAAEGRPLLIMALHLGNWEVIPPVLMKLGHTKGSGFYLPPENRFDHWVAVAARKKYGANKLVIPGPNASREAYTRLKSGEGFIVFADEFVRGRVHAPAFGRPLRHAGSNIAYIARLAAMTDAVVVPVYAVRHGDEARFTVRFLPAVGLQRTSDRKADLEENVQRLDSTIEPVIRQHLDQWFYVLDFDFSK